MTIKILILQLFHCITIDTYRCYMGFIRFLKSIFARPNPNDYRHLFLFRACAQHRWLPTQNFAGDFIHFHLLSPLTLTCSKALFSCSKIQTFSKTDVPVYSETGTQIGIFIYMVERPDPKNLSTFSQCTESRRIGDWTSCFPDLELDTLNKMAS